MLFWFETRGLCFLELLESSERRAPSLDGLLRELFEPQLWTHQIVSSHAPGTAHGIPWPSADWLEHSVQTCQATHPLLAHEWAK